MPDFRLEEADPQLISPALSPESSLEGQFDVKIESREVALVHT